MEFRFGPRGIVEIDDAVLVFKNFEGRGDKFNREGDRNFAIRIPNQEIADEFIAAGWNVRIKPPREEGEDPFIYLPVKIKFNERGPAVYLHSGRAINRLEEDTVGMLDNVDILSVDLDIRPYDWDVNGKTGRTAYLQSIHVTQNIDRFAARYAEEEYPRE